MPAKITSSTNVARQPNAICNTPPMVGATIGAKAVIDAHDRQFAARPRAGINIAHHRPRQHDHAGAAQRLHEAQRDQGVDRLREGAADAGEAVEHQRRQQDRLAAERSEIGP